MAFTETRINDDSCIPYLDGYSFEHRDSPSTFGGVGIYVSSLINYSVRNDLHLDVSGCENIWVEIELKNAKKSKRYNSIVVGVVYRHPGSKYETFCEKLCDQLLMFNEKKIRYIITGDINIDLN